MPLSLWRQSTQRPPVGPFKLDMQHPLGPAGGLIACVLFNDYGSATIWEACNNLVLQQSGTPSWGTGGGSGPGGFVTNASSTRADVVFPDTLKYAWPISIVWSGYKLPAGALVAFAGIFGVSANNTDAAPYEAYALNADINGAPQMFFSRSTGNGGITSGAIPGAGPLWLAGMLQKSQQAFYVNNPYTPTATSNATGGVQNSPQYSSTSMLSFGSQTGTTQNAGVVHLAGHIYNRLLSTAELAQLKAEPYCMVQTRSFQRFWSVTDFAWEAPSVNSPNYRTPASFASGWRR